MSICSFCDKDKIYVMEFSDTNNINNNICCSCLGFHVHAIGKSAGEYLEFRKHQSKKLLKKDKDYQHALESLDKYLNIVDSMIHNKEEIKKLIKEQIPQGE